MSLDIPQSIIEELVYYYFKETRKSGDINLRFHSPFKEGDRSFCCSINLETGLWIDYKTENAGNLFQLVAYMEEITYKQAERNVLLKAFHKEDCMFFGDKVITRRPVDKPKTVQDYLDKFLPIEKSDKEAYEFLVNRRLLIDPSMPVGFDINPENGRLVIPFRTPGGYYYFFQERALLGETPKYLNPPSSCGVKISTILYPFDETLDYVVVTEGPLDAISLQLQGVNATATMTARISPVQANILKRFSGKIILGFDNDEAGKKGIESFEVLRKQKCMEEFYVCPPPSQYKDWNEAHQQFFPLKDYVKENQERYSYEEILRKEIQDLP